MEQTSTQFYIPAICAQELLQGARDHKEYKLLRSYLITQDLLIAKDPVTTHFEAAKLYFDCRKKGITIRSTVDCFIAQLVIENQAMLLHADKYFTQMSSVRKIQFVL